MNFERARSKEQKDIRKDQIIKATLSLYGDLSYEKITLAAIAKELSFTRANLYKYTSSKEEIFLWIILSDFQIWVDDLESSFEGISDLSMKDFSCSWTAVIERNTRLIELFSILYTVLEQNVKIDKLALFKRELFQSYGPLFPLLKRLLPLLDEEQIDRFIHMQLFYAMGLYPGTLVNDIQKEAIKMAHVSFSLPQFVPEFERFILFTLQGLQGEES